MKKILYVVTSDSFMKAFNLPYLRWFKEHGYEVHVAYENRFGYNTPYCDKVIDLPFKRNPFHPQNFKAYKALKRIISEHQYELVHCHTPIPAAITRLAAANSRKTGTKVLYTAHGFHFYAGASVKNWLVYFTAEKLLSSITDGIVTINKDDYQTAQKYFSSSKIFYISGVGVDVTKYKPFPKEKIEEFRKSIQLEPDDFALLYVAEFIPRKDHQFILNALPQLIKRIPNLKVLFAGRGSLLEKSKNFVKENGLDAYVQFLGFRQDLNQIIPASDVCVSTSKQEGLGLGLAEGMMCAKPVVATKIRGHADLVDSGESGFLFELNNQSEFIDRILRIYKDTSLRRTLGEKAFNKIQGFSIEKSLNAMDGIYSEFLK